jgi:opacity protein-like surface antigen
MSKAKVIIDFSTNRYSDLELKNKSDNIVICLTENPKFATLAPKATQIKAQVDDFDSFLARMAQGNKQLTVEKNYPINMSDFSLHADLNFTKSGYSYNSESYNNNLSLNQNIIFLANTSSINLPVLLRYTFPYMHIKPFLNVGLIYTYNIINSTAIYTSTIYPTYIETSTIDKTSLISKSQLGFSCGTGVEYKLNNRHAVFIELRYNKLHSSSSDYILNKSEFQIITGINI